MKNEELPVNNTVYILYVSWAYEGCSEPRKVFAKKPTQKQLREYFASEGYARLSSHCLKELVETGKTCPGSFSGPGDIIYLTEYEVC